MTWSRRGAVGGYSLIEMMIVTAIGTSFFAGALALVGNTTAVLAHYRQHQEAVAMIDRVLLLMTTEIARHGFIAGNDHEQHILPIVISQHGDEAEASCVLFAYDSNKNGQLDPQNPAEYRGFRLRDHAIEMRVAQKHCQAAGWQDVTVKSLIKMTEFSARFNSANTLAISVTGELLLPNKVQLKRTKVVYIPNYIAGEVIE